MKHCLTALILSLGLASAAEAAPLKVDISGIEARGGKLYVSIQTEAQFMKDEGTAGQIIDAPDAGTFSATFDVPEGRYAVSIWHDDNDNGIFDMGGPYDTPADGWAMHNGRNLTGAPTFDQIAIDVPAGGANVSERIAYGR